MNYRITTLLATLIFAAFALSAQQPEVPVDTTDTWQVSLLTCAPGSEIYELEGHSGLRLVNQSRGVDVVVNWGLFDFASPGFVYRFVKGETDYMAGAAPLSTFLYGYASEGRRVVEQQLALTPEQAARVVDLVQTNLRPENRVYRYNYVSDNCATRPLAVIERAIGDTLSLGHAEPAIDRATTFRKAMRHYHRNYPWYQFGIDLALGTPIDLEVPHRAMTFSPVALSQMLEEATLPSGEPLVSREEELEPGPEEGIAAGPTPWYLGPTAASWLLLLLTIAITLWDLATGRLSRGFDVALYTLFGLAGCLITFLVFFSVHEPASPNWLLLWLNPLCLLPLFLIWTKGGRRLLMWWQMINFVALIGMCAVWIAGVQALNGAFIPLIISDGVRSLFFIFYSRCSTPQSRRKHPMVYRTSLPAASYMR